MTRQEEPPQGRRGSLAPHTLYEAEAAELTNLSVDCPFTCGETTALRLWSAKDDCTAHADDPAAPDTVLYLAYGSNMCAQTFLGMRKIKPLSQMNVYTPSLRLTFSLPGVAYIEPCFANVDYYRHDERSEKPEGSATSSPDKNWDGCLMGVVYEVTKADWRNIMRTEGGGASYKEIVVPCIPLPDSNGAEDLPKSFMARTLHAPRNADDKRPGNGSLWDRLTTGPFRPRDDYAQPSLRYLKLLRTGAKEHNLPAAYRDYLESLEPYTSTHISQNVGKFAFILAFGPFLLIMLRVSSLFADESGNTPKPVSTFMTMYSNIVWFSYDYLLKPIFGDGERTQRKDTGKREAANGKSEKESLLNGRQ